MINPHALIIGVGAYDDPQWEAPVAVYDAQALYAALTDAQGAAYPPGQVTFLRDAEASPAGITDGFRRLADRTGPDDTVLISFTGHGALGDDDLYYLGAYGTRFTPTRIIGGTGFSVADLFRALKEITARRLLLIINACFAGHAGASLATDLSRGAVIPDTLAAELAQINEGRAILTASRAGQYSYFPRTGQSSYFGAALVEALRGAGSRPENGVIGLFELYSQVHRQTRQVVERLGYEQEPVLTLLQGVGPFPIARYPGAPPTAEGTIRQRPPADTPVRVVEKTIRAEGQGAIAVNAEQGSTVSISNEKNVGVDFSGANVSGVVQIGQASAGNIIVNGGSAPTSHSLAPAIKRLRERTAALSDGDPDARDDAALKFDQAVRALEGNDSERAMRRLREAAAALRNQGSPNATAIAALAEALATTMP
jgi:hypothetical protein